MTYLKIKQMGGRLLRQVLLWGVAFVLYACGGGSHDDTAVHAVDPALQQDYDRAREVQHKGDYRQAVALFDRCIQHCGQSPKVNDSLVALAANAMVQMMNSYQSMGRPVDCINRFSQMAHHPSPFVRRYCLRDVHVLLAYSLSRTDREEEAVAVMDQAMKMKLAAPGHDRLFRDYAYASAVYFCQPGRQADASRYGRKALAEAGLSKTISGAQWVSALLGVLYRRNGDIASAIDMYDESFNVAETLGDTLGMANARNSMADLLLSWQMPDYAADYAAQAVDIVARLHNTNPMVVCNVLVNQAKVKTALGQPDSAVCYLDRAETYCRDLPYNSGQSEVDLQRARLYMARKDTEAKGILLMKKVAGQGSVSIKAQALCELSRWYIARQDDRAADKTLSAMYATLTSGDHPVAIYEAYELGLRYYLSKDDKEKAAAFAQALCQPGYDRIVMLNKMANTLVKFKTLQQNSELKMKEMAAEKQIHTIVSVCLLVVLVLVALMSMLMYSRKMARLRQRLVESQLVNLSDQITTLTIDKEMMQSKLETIRMEEMKTGNINPKTLKEEGDEVFRSHFCKLYPSFLNNLRAAVPGISRREELLCMLIALDQDTYQIERILCVAHNSVNMARYRLRTKMGLVKGQSLETAVKDILMQKD